MPRNLLKTQTARKAPGFPELSVFFENGAGCMMIHLLTVGQRRNNAQALYVAIVSNHQRVG
jgi:hypothetical protein